MVGNTIKSYVNPQLYSFEYENIHLLPSLWKTKWNQTLDTYLSISNDSLLYGFRKRAHFDTPGEELTGWYCDGGTNFGQLLSVYAKFYRITKNEKIKEKLLFLVNEWIKCQREDGFGIYPDGHDDTYLFEKLETGLLDTYEYAQCQIALEGARKYADYTIQTIPLSFPRDGNHTPEMISKGVIEWYTLSESMFRLYQFTNEKRYYDFACRMLHNSYFNEILNNKKPSPRHAYSHVNALTSAAEAYWITHDKQFMNIIVKAYNLIYKTETFITGGYGPAEILFGPEGYLGDSILSLFDTQRKGLTDPYTFTLRQGVNDNFEISCCSWAVFKLTRHLLMATREAKYASWAEKLLINGIGAMLPVENNGRIMYYANYAVNGSYKTTEDNRLRSDGSNFRWQCCTGTFPQTIAEIVNMIFYKDNNDGIYIAQFVSSKGKILLRNACISIRIESNYPMPGSINISLYSTKKTFCKLYIRFPEWTDDFSLLIDNKTINPVIEKNWIVVEFVLKEKTTITINYLWRLRFNPVDRQHQDIVALTYGPVVLAADEMSILHGSLSDPSRWIHQIPGKVGWFLTDKGHDKAYDHLQRCFRPYYQFLPMEYYYLYNRVENTD